MDLAQATGQPETLTLECGEEIAARPLLVSEWGRLQAWYKQACPSPVTRVMHALQQLRDDGGAVSEAVEEQMMDHAQRAALNWPPRVGSSVWFDALLKADGAIPQFLLTVVGAADPSFTPARAETLAARLTTADLSALLRVAYFGSHPAPKAATATATR